MLHFMVGLIIGLIIMAPLIALVILAGFSPKHAKEGAPRREADPYPVSFARSRRPFPGLPG